MKRTQVFKNNCNEFAAFARIKHDEISRGHNTAPASNH